MIGLEGSGFILSVGLTLLIAGTIIYYVNNKFKETSQQLQTVLKIVQQVNSSRDGGHTQHHTHPTRQENPPLVDIEEEDDDDLISVSDDEDSDVSSTTTETPIIETTILIDDESAIPENKNIIVDLPIGVGEYISEMSDKSEDTSEDDDVELGETPEVLLDATSGGDLDTMLLNIIDIHKKSTTTSNLQDLKVTDLREMIKEKGIKATNLGKLKKSECIELLS